MQSNQVNTRGIASRLITWMVVTALVLSFIVVSVPNLLSSRRSANESSAVGSLRTINTAIVSYQAKSSSGSYPEKLSDLYTEGYIDQSLGSGKKSGYGFRYRGIDNDGDGVADSYRVDAIPLQPGTTGTTRFKTDESAVILAAKYAGGPLRTLDGESATQNESSRETSRSSPGRKVTRNSCIELIVERPSETATQVRALTAQVGGYVESTRIEREDGRPVAEMKIRVPAARYEEARERIRGLGRSAGEETDNSHDITGAYVDLDATLRNYRAEEAQYLEIMKRAGSIKDTLAVAEKLADVRGRIERTQGQLTVLSQQVAMASLSVTLRTEPVVPVADVRWHPVAQTKAAFWSGVDNLATYANFMLGVIFQLPVMLLWMFTVVLASAVGWKLLRWSWRRFFVACAPSAVG